MQQKKRQKFPHNFRTGSRFVHFCLKLVRINILPLTNTDKRSKNKIQENLFRLSDVMRGLKSPNQQESRMTLTNDISKQERTIEKPIEIEKYVKQFDELLSKAPQKYRDSLGSSTSFNNFSVFEINFDDPSAIRTNKFSVIKGKRYDKLMSALSADKFVIFEKLVNLERHSAHPVK